MCGLIGLVATSRPLGPWFPEAILSAGHRGPDAATYWLPDMPGPCSVESFLAPEIPPSHVALGFTRLRILDLSEAAAQPMVVPGRATVVFNGEIYNFVELRQELEAAGWSFRSTGDTEVLLKGYLHWGIELLPRLNGMWALAIYDADKRSVLLSRDRFGEKPLFWTRWDDGFAFGSEIKQLTVLPGVNRRLSRERAAEYLITGRPLSGGTSTWFEGIEQIEPGTWMEIGPGRRRRSGRYYRAIAAIQSRSVKDWEETFAALLSDAVRLRLRADVQIGTSLSSGVDSATILAEAIAHGGTHHSFTLASDDRRIDESARAQALALAAGSTWHAIRPEPQEFADVWDLLTFQHEYPVSRTSIYGQWKIHEAARALNILVMLDGQGADEILGGYYKFFAAVVWRHIRRSPITAAPDLLSFARHVGGWWTLASGYRYFGPLSGASRRRSFVLPGLLPERAPASPGLADGASMRLADIERWSLPNLLSYADRSAMAHGVETRLPYLDFRLVDLALAMPDEVLVRGGWTKWPLRRALARLGFPAAAWRRGKMGFGVPQSAWLHGPLSAAIDEWRTRPHPVWGEVASEEALEGMRQTLRPGSSRLTDDLLFEAVALDRFFRVWIP